MFNNNIMDLEALIKENELLKEEVKSLKEKLDKYTNQHKKYYESNKEIVIEKAKVRLKKLNDENPEKIKEYRKRAYLKRKEKIIGELKEK
jgi:hypothetical protein